MRRTTYKMRLLGGFGLCRGPEEVEVPASTQRLLGFLALQSRPQSRSFVADVLWPDADPNRGNANLRTSLWRLRAQHVGVIEARGTTLVLDECVCVDVRCLRNALRELERSGRLPHDPSFGDLRGELLPGYWDAWLVFERERVRQEVVHLHETTSRTAITRGDLHVATMSALAAVECDPLRESANQLLLRALVAAGNTACAVRHALGYASLLETELGVPSPPFVEELLWANRTSIVARLHAIAGEG